MDLPIITVFGAPGFLGQRIEARVAHRAAPAAAFGQSVSVCASAIASSSECDAFLAAVSHLREAGTAPNTAVK
jgi:hypothetical protein